VNKRNVFDRLPVHHGNGTFRGPSVHHPNIIERAYQLASSSSDLDQIRKTLRHEGYSNVDAHLAGASIKADLKRQFIR
jgi:tRNA G26 N,N-dimethylase Trm1